MEKEGLFLGESTYFKGETSFKMFNLSRVGANFTIRSFSATIVATWRNGALIMLSPPKVKEVKSPCSKVGLW